MIRNRPVSQGGLTYPHANRGLAVAGPVIALCGGRSRRAGRDWNWPGAVPIYRVGPLLCLRGAGGVEVQVRGALLGTRLMCRPPPLGTVK
jgi:hypothetical protein